MKILFLSTEGNSFPLAMEMMEEGHEVKFFVKNEDEAKAGDGFVPKSKDYKGDISWADLVISDDTGFGQINDLIREKGTPVIGGTALSDALEEDRGIGQRIFSKLGFKTLESHEFKKISEAVQFVEKNPARYVVKVSGEAQEDKTLTYVSQLEDGRDIGPVLLHMEKKKGISSIELQEAVTGTEVAIGGFFNGKDFLDPVLVNFEHKALMPGDKYSPTQQKGIGPATGEMGTVGIWKDKGFKLYSETLEKFVPILKEEGYRGYFDINCIVQNDWENGGYIIRPLEMTNRFGWPTLPLQMETMKINDLGELFYGIATGQAEDFKVTNQYSVCVVIGVPPLPYISEELAESMSNGMPIIFKNPDDKEGICPGDVYLEDEDWIITGKKGYACVCSAGGDSIQEARNSAYSKVQNIVIPNMMVRFDIGETTESALSSIKGLMSHEPVPDMQTDTMAPTRP